MYLCSPAVPPIGIQIDLECKPFDQLLPQDQWNDFGSLGSRLFDYVTSEIRPSRVNDQIIQCLNIELRAERQLGHY
jgi:hypothetical protein